MTIELAIFISTAGLLFNTIIIWVIGRMSQTQREVTNRLWNRLNYLEVSLSYHGMVPLPWEIEDCEEDEKIKTFKQEGNVVYLQKKD
jgi:hypothetical protein